MWTREFQINLSGFYIASSIQITVLLNSRYISSVSLFLNCQKNSEMYSLFILGAILFREKLFLGRTSWPSLLTAANFFLLRNVYK